MDKKTIKSTETGPVRPEDLPYINAVVRSGETVEIRPGLNDTAKIMKVTRKFIKTGRETDRPKSGKEL